MFENDIINVLLNIGLKKQAQSNAIDIDAYLAATPLVNNLLSEVAPKEIVKEVTVNPLTAQTGVSSPITTSDLRNLGDLLNWAVKNKIEWRGSRLAFGPKENQPEGWAIYNAYTGARDRDDKRVPTTEQIYANQDKVKEFLSYLRDSEESRKNKVFQVMLGSIIDDFNKYVDEGNSLARRPEKLKEKDVSDEDLEKFKDLVVDGFTSGIFDTSKPTDGIDAYPNFNRLGYKLSIKDLFGTGTLLDWFNKNQIKIKQKSGETVNASEDKCGAIHVLYERAKYLSNVVVGQENKLNAFVPNYSKAVKTYLKLVISIGSSFTDKDGNKCVIEGYDPSKTNQGAGSGAGGGASGKGTGTSPGGGSGGAGAGSATSGAGGAGAQGAGTGGSGADAGDRFKTSFNDDIDKIAKMAPLDYRAIDRTDINAFFEAYKKLLTDPVTRKIGGGDQSGIFINMSMATEAFKLAGKYLTNPNTYIFPLNVGFGYYINQLKEQTINFVPFIDTLMKALDATYYVIFAFEKQYAYRGSNLISDFSKSVLSSQCGWGPGQPSVYSENRSALNELKVRANIRMT